jgi:hypothetical protein
MAKIVFVIACVLLAGCYPLTIESTRLDAHVSVSSPQDRSDRYVAAQFETETKASWLIWGLVQLSDADVEGALQRELDRHRGAAVTDLEIVTTQTFVDGLLSVITLGLYGQRSVILRGRIVPATSQQTFGGTNDDD